MKTNKFFLSALLLFFPSMLMASEVVNVYSARIDKLIKPAFDAFTKKTGIRVQYTTGKAPVLLERLRQEGRYTKADLLITVDAGNLWYAAKSKVLTSVESAVLNRSIPTHLRDSKGMWYGLTVRSRTIVYSKDRVTPTDLSTYENLGDDRWKNRLCLRTSKKVYNKSLVATMIAATSEEKTREVLTSWMRNKPVILPKDSGVLKAIAAGQCDVGIVNTYYLGRMLKKNPNFPVGLFWANQQDRGVHVNISGAGVTRYGKNRQNAIRLLEFLASEEAQNLFADENMEYPVNTKSAPSSQIVSWWGERFKMDSINLTYAGIYQRRASKLMKEVGYR